VDFELLNEKLNELGREGWEVVNATDVNMHLGETRDVMIILKRPLNDN